MLKRRKWFFLLGGALAAIALLALLTSKREPSYQGQSLRDWLLALTHYNPDDDPTQAAEAIRQIGTNGIPYLVQYLSYTPSPLRLKSSEAMTALARRLGGDWAAEGDRNQACAEGAFMALQILGPAAAAGAIPDLTQLVAAPGSWAQGTRAIFALGHLGSQALPPLMAVLTNHNSGLRPQAALSLAVLGTNAGPAVPILIGYLRERNENLARFSAMSLGRLRQEPDLVVPAMIDALQDSRPSIRRVAAEALGKYGDQARPAVPALLDALNDMDKLTRKATTNALRVIAPETLTNPPAR